MGRSGNPGPDARHARMQQVSWQRGCVERWHDPRALAGRAVFAHGNQAQFQVVQDARAESDLRNAKLSECSGAKCQ